MRLETKIALCATVLVLVIMGIAPVGSQEFKGKITLTVNPDGSMNMEANLRVPLPPETSIEADGTTDYNPSAGETVIQATIDVTLAPSILATLPVRNVNASFSGTETTAKGTLGLELLPSEQIPVQGILANLNSQTDVARNVTTINADGYYTVAYVRPWSKDNVTAFIVLLQSQLKSIVPGIANSTNNTVQVTKLEFGSQPDLFDTYAKSTFSATVVLLSTRPTLVPGLSGDVASNLDILFKIMAEQQKRNLARIRTWQAEGTYSATDSKIKASYKIYLTGDIDTNINTTIDVYKELVQSGAIKDFDTRLMPLFDTRVSVKGSSFKITTTQGELQITVAGIVLKPPVERTPTGFRISPNWISAASTQLRETSQGLEFTVQGNGVNIMVSPEAPKPLTATSSKVVWPDFNVNLLSHLEFVAGPVTTTTASTTTMTTPATTSAFTTTTTIAPITTSATTTSTTTAGPIGLELPTLLGLIAAVIIIIVLAAVMLLRRKKKTAQIPAPPPDPMTAAKDFEH